ncbi:uncharacterized protein SPSK_06241 [Sporothrix schenckii 1099-18]|uniref:Uncharacterized protein n=1 Tax=Sporothrix schenckii 1099-18 TaxID=1397361 RepID=A0A0F2MN50_SPOSC|nr:uncharacterized protein SPSK_06241 [Sporothrix schenckii 1099-18]KJR89606.1 hypothetical protein SPSK_06241 [Sporothrix schenckii 1099-18]
MLSAFTQATKENFIGRQVLSNNRTLDHFHGVTAQAVVLQGGLNLDAVNERLQVLSDENVEFLPRTPSEASTVDPPSPLEGEELVQFYREEEARFRQELIETGCPPCHPPDYTFPYDTEDRLPKEHPAAMFHIINERNGHGFMPLVDQLREWDEFRDFQKRVREDFQNDPKHRTPEYMLEEYMLDGRYLLKRRKFNESASLVDWSLDVAKQSRVQNWLEYQVREIGLRKSMWAIARHNIRGAYDAEARQWHVNYEKRRIAAHGAMLVWMEEQRVIMSAAEKNGTSSKTTREQPVPDEEGTGHGDTSDHEAAGTTLASALAGCRRSSRLRTRPGSTDAESNEKKKQSVSFLRPRQTWHKDQQQPPAAVIPHSQRSQVSPETRQPPAGPGIKAATRQRPRPNGAQRRSAGITKKQKATTRPVYTRYGRQIRQPDRLGWT